MKIIDLLYGLLLLIGVFAGLYGIGYEISWLRWIGAFLVIGMPIMVDALERILRKED